MRTKYGYSYINKMDELLKETLPFVCNYNVVNIKTLHKLQVQARGTIYLGMLLHSLNAHDESVLYIIT